MNSQFRKLIRVLSIRAEEEGALTICAASLNNLPINAATLVRLQTPKTFKCSSNKMQLQSLLQQQLKFYWNIRICDFNLVTNFVIHSFIL